MKVYRVKGKGSTMTYVEIVEEQEDEIYLMVTRQVDGEKRISKERISRHLFQVCLETGYLLESPPMSSPGSQKKSA